MPLRPILRTAVLQIPDGSIAIPLELDFTTARNGGDDEFDLMAELMQEAGISFVQGIFIDQGNSNDTLTLAFANTANQGFTLRIPGKVQTWQPLLLPIGAARFTADSAIADGKKIQLHLVNFPVMPIMWNVP